MSVRGLSDLLVAIMAAGDVDALDAQDPRLAHRAVAAVAATDTDAARHVLARYGVSVQTIPDPDVGLRVSGLTDATWKAVARGLLEPHEAGQQAWYTMPAATRMRARREVMRLDLAEAGLLQRIGADWAASSTARNTRARPGRSVAPSRALNLA